MITLDTYESNFILFAHFKDIEFSFEEMLRNFWCNRTACSFKYFNESYIFNFAIELLKKCNLLTVSNVIRIANAGVKPEYDMTFSSPKWSMIWTIIYGIFSVMQIKEGDEVLFEFTEKDPSLFEIPESEKENEDV